MLASENPLPIGVRSIVLRTVPAPGATLHGSVTQSLRELGRHSVYALAGAQSVVRTRLLVARLDARSTSMNQSEASCQN